MERTSVNKTVTPAKFTSDADHVLAMTMKMAGLTISDKESRLLTLPMELLERITDCAIEDALPMLRLASRTLETATMNRFTTIFLQERWLHVHDQTRWLLLNNLLSTRFASRIREITLTTDDLEGKTYSMLQFPPPMNMRYEELVRCRAKTGLKAGRSTFVETRLHRGPRPSAALIRHVMANVKRFAPNAQMKLDLVSLKYDNLSLRGGLQGDIMLAVFANKVPLMEFELNDDSIAGSPPPMAHLDPNMAICFSSLQDFSYRQLIHNNWPITDNREEHEQKREDAWLDAFQKGLKTSTELRRLRLSFGRMYAEYLGHPARCLLRNSFPHLQHLSIDHGQFVEEDLVVALSACRLTLVSFDLWSIHLLDCHQPWLQTLQLLASMPNLRRLSLGSLEAGKFWMGPDFDCWLSDRTLFVGHVNTNVTDGRTYALKCEGREQVTAALQALLSSPLQFD